MKVSIRSKVEHPFRLLKNLFGYRKVRRRGLEKYTEQAHPLFALANLVIAKGRFLALDSQGAFWEKGERPEKGRRNPAWGFIAEKIDARGLILWSSTIPLSLVVRPPYLVKCIDQQFPSPLRTIGIKTGHRYLRSRLPRLSRAAARL